MPRNILSTLLLSVATTVHSGKLKALPLQVDAACLQVSKSPLLDGALLGRRRLVKLFKLKEPGSVETKKRSEERFSFT
jgi:hypothetical protein